MVPQRRQRHCAVLLRRRTYAVKRPWQGTPASRMVFLCLPGVIDPARSAHPLPWRSAQCCPLRVRGASAPKKRPIAGLNTLPAPSPVNASLPPLPGPAQDSGPMWVANPSLSETCTPSHYADLSRHTRTLGEANALLASVQRTMVTQHTEAYLAQHATCAQCGKPHRRKGMRPIV
jgi:hypothetical protein